MRLYLEPPRQIFGGIGHNGGPSFLGDYPIGYQACPTCGIWDGNGWVAPSYADIPLVSTGDVGQDQVNTLIWTGMNPQLAAEAVYGDDYYGANAAHPEAGGPGSFYNATVSAINSGASPTAAAVYGYNTTIDPNSQNYTGDGPIPDMYTTGHNAAPTTITVPTPIIEPPKDLKPAEPTPTEPVLTPAQIAAAAAAKAAAQQAATQPVQNKPAVNTVTNPGVSILRNNGVIDPPTAPLPANDTKSNTWLLAAAGGAVLLMAMGGKK